VFQVTGKLTGSSPQRLSKANYQKYLREFRKLSRQFTKLSPATHTEMIRKAGVEYVERLVKVSHGMHQSMEAIMSSVVLESWTAFEILASDLWVAAVDNGPQRNRPKGFGSQQVGKG